MPGRGKGNQALADLFLGTSIIKQGCVDKHILFVFVLHYTAVLDRAIHYLLSEEVFQLQEGLLNLTGLHDRSKIAQFTRHYLSYSYNSVLIADHNQNFYLLVELFSCLCNLLYINHLFDQYKIEMLTKSVTWVVHYHTRKQWTAPALL